MRRALDTLYDAAGYLAALFLAGTLAMAAGMSILAIAFVDELVLELQGQRSRATPEEAVHSE